MADWRDERESDMMPDRQRAQSMAIVSLIMHAIDRHLPRDGRAHKYVARDLFDALDKAGIEIITAEDRAKAGLPPRGPKGWTKQELHILEMKRLEAMLSSMPTFIMPIDTK